MYLPLTCIASLASNYITLPPFPTLQKSYTDLSGSAVVMMSRNFCDDEQLQIGGQSTNGNFLKRIEGAGDRGQVFEGAV